MDRWVCQPPNECIVARDAHAGWHWLICRAGQPVRVDRTNPIQAMACVAVGVAARYGALTVHQAALSHRPIEQ